MNANKQDAGGLLPCPFCGGEPIQYDYADGYGIHCGNVECTIDMFATSRDSDADARAIWNRRNGELCRAAPAGGDVECFVREMRTSKGSEFFVVVRCNGRELTPHMYAERWKAEYDVASWQHLLCGAPEPDLLAYGPSEDSAPAGSGEVEELVQKWRSERIPLVDNMREHGQKHNAHAKSYNAALTACADELTALLCKLQQGAAIPPHDAEEYRNIVFNPDERTSAIIRQAQAAGWNKCRAWLIAASQGQEGGHG